jgi:hypothetical protein
MQRLFTLCILSLAIGSPLFANYPPTPHGLKGYWESTEPGGKRQFRMVPYGIGSKADYYFHRQFPSGLYSDSKATKPLWSVDFYEESICWPNESAELRPLYLSENGRWLVRVRAVANKPNDTVLWFYEDGKLIQSHTLRDVLGDDAEAGPEPWLQRMGFAEPGTVQISIPAGWHSWVWHDFDAKTGKLIGRTAVQSTRRINDFGFVLLAIGVLLLVFAVIWNRRKRRNASP